MKELKLFCEDVRIDTRHGSNDLELILTNVGNESIVGLFEKIIESDEDILHNYLESAGYIFSKERMR